MAGPDAPRGKFLSQWRAPALLDATAFETRARILQIAEPQTSGIALVLALQANEATHIRSLAPKHYLIGTVGADPVSYITKGAKPCADATLFFHCRRCWQSR